MDDLRSEEFGNEGLERREREQKVAADLSGLRACGTVVGDGFSRSGTEPSRNVFFFLSSN